MDLINIHDSQSGYDSVADYYDSWIWQTFWEMNELPLILDLITDFSGHRVLDIGCGTGKLLSHL